MRRALYDFIVYVGWEPFFARVVGRLNDWLEKRQETPPPVRHLVGVAELAAMLDVSKQRASQLANSPHFPDPVARLALGPVWRVAAIERWAKAQGRPLGPVA